MVARMTDAFRPLRAAALLACALAATLPAMTGAAQTPTLPQGQAQAPAQPTAPYTVVETGRSYAGCRMR
jgi:hypothetical protein